MLRVQISLYISPVLTLKPKIQGHPFSDTAHSDKWCFVPKRSEICAHNVCGAKRQPYAVSSNKSLHLTCVDLETHNSRSSIFVNNFLDRATDQTESARSARNGSKVADLRMVRPLRFRSFNRYDLGLLPPPKKKKIKQNWGSE